MDDTEPSIGDDDSSESDHGYIFRPEDNGYLFKPLLCVEEDFLESSDFTGDESSVPSEFRVCEKYLQSPSNPPEMHSQAYEIYTSEKKVVKVSQVTDTSYLDWGDQQNLEAHFNK